MGKITFRVLFTLICTEWIKNIGVSDQVTDRFPLLVYKQLHLTLSFPELKNTYTYWGDYLWLTLKDRGIIFVVKKI